MGILHVLVFALLCFADPEFFYKLKVCGDPASSKSVGAFFQQHLPTSSLCVTFWLFSQYFKLFHYFYIWYGDLWSVCSLLLLL